MLHQVLEPAISRRCFTIAQFCEWLGISRAHYFAMRRRGQGPAELRYGRKVLITAEACTAFVQGRC